VIGRFDRAHDGEVTTWEEIYTVWKRLLGKRNEDRSSIWGLIAARPKGVTAGINRSNTAA
jgi:hypothetical protein